MAVFIKKSRTKILSRYDKPFRYGESTIYGGEAAKITNIRKLERDVNTFRSQGDNRIKDLPPENIFSYDVFFRVDMREVLELNINSLRFSVALSHVRSKLGNFTAPGTTDSPKRVIAALFKGNRESTRLSKIEKSNKVIGEGVINLNPYINECNNLNLQNTDESIFGRKKSISLSKINPEKDGQFQKNLAFYSENFENREIDDLKSAEVDFSEEYYRMIELGIDPATLFFPDPGFCLSSESTLKKNSELYPVEIRKNRVDLIRSKIRPIPTSNKNIKLDYKSGEIAGKIIAEETSVIDRYKVIKFSFDVRDKELNGSSDFLFTVIVDNTETGMSSEKLDITIPHQSLVENYYIPDYLPDMYMFKHDKGIGDTSVDFSICNIQNEKVGRLKTRIRTIEDDAPLIHSRYNDKALNFRYSDITAARNQKSYRLRNYYNMSETQMLVGRSFVSTVTGQSISNIQNSTVEKGSLFDYIYSGMDIDKEDGGFVINYFSKSSRVSGFLLYRKMLGEFRFTPVNHPLDSSSGLGRTGDHADPGEIQMNAGDAISFQGSVGQGGSIKDRIGPSPNREDKIFLYRKKILLKSGGSVWSKNLLTVKKEKSLNLVTVDIKNLKVPRSPSNDTVQNGVEFEIHGGLASTNTDIILEILRDQNKEGIFSDIIQTTRGSLSDLLIFGVTRTNLTNSSVEFLGYYRPGRFAESDIEIDLASVGSRYKYTISSYLINPELVEKYFNLSVDYNKSVITKTDQVRMPTFIQNLQRVAASETKPDIGSRSVDTQSIKSFENLKLQKYYSGKQMQVGEISSIDSFSQDYDFEKYSTGDLKNIYVDLTSVNIQINPEGRGAVTRTHSGCPVVRFAVTGDVDMIDFIILTCVRNGIEKIVGTCMIENDNRVVFVDYTSSNFIGQADYYATPIFLDGQIGERKQVGEVVLLQHQPSNINGKSTSQRGY